MVVRSLDVNKDPFWLKEEDEELLVMYLTNNTRPDITFTINLLARFSSSPTRQHWNGIKHVLGYLQGTIDLELFYSNIISPKLISYAGAGYLSYSHNACSQIGYVFTNGGTAISWHSSKKSMVATSSNH
ncbi:hypothetical protein M9H77_22812 [Catharanthus roseus]|uniref:Uncharacterized protein n=1 Tax=Catharanthus roseus TaxID=4058 RepID=A0ACC0ARI8_CATRO|nr:hypothetical protein M9H77_22812 [Catharanthus roseus]